MAIGGTEPLSVERRKFVYDDFRKQILFHAETLKSAQLLIIQVPMGHLVDFPMGTCIMNNCASKPSA